MSASNSDVRRGRAILIAAVIAAASALTLLALRDGPSALVSPGPLGAGHARAELACSDCHATSSTADACAGCHAGQRSRREQHRALAAKGALGCADCHRSHGSEAVVVAGAGTSAPHLFPLISRERCERCHTPEQQSDAAFHCFAPGRSESLCFDEHARTAPAARGRDAARERARGVVLGSTLGSGRSAWQENGTALVASLGVALIGFLSLGFRVRPRRGANRAAGNAPPRKRLPVIDPARCLGCAACVDACPHDVLEVENYVAVVARPDSCCGLTLCAERCPNGSLVIAEGEPVRNLPRLSSELESLDQPGIYLAGDIGGGGSLIRRAVEQGQSVARAAAVSLRAEGRARGTFDAAVSVIGAGPAGLSAGLVIQQLGLRGVLIEQGRLAESIQSFPRGKIVLGGAAPHDDLPLFVAECEKDELVRRWLRSTHKAGLDVREHSRVGDIRRAPGSAPRFEVEFEDPEGERRRVSARRVVIATGSRGSPRKLEIEVPRAAEDRVHYCLSDAKSFAGKRVVIVGLGDTALEAASALVEQPETTVELVYRGAEFRRGKRKNLEQIERLIEAGRVRIAWSTEVRRIAQDHLLLSGPAGEERRAYDALFVLIGALTETELLKRAGVRSNLP